MASTTALLSAGITIVISIVYTTLSSLAIHVRSSCDAGITQSGSKFFLNSMLKLYFKQTGCAHSILNPNVTQEHTVFMMTCLTLSFSLVCLLSAVAYIYVVCYKRGMKYVQPVGYLYVVALLLSIVTDITIAAHFGMDYATFSERMNNSSPGVSINYERDMFRLAALLLMIVGLKGCVPALNIVFVTLLVWELKEQNTENVEHSVHQEGGALQAFEQPRYNNDMMINSTFVVSKSDYPPPSSDVEPSRSPNLSPWRRNQLTVQSRPFSYLDIPRQPVMKSSSPISHQWQPDSWDTHAPPLPVPDYSPEAPRRLKSALKSTFM